MKPGIGEVAKRSNAADCKSVAHAASKVRILPSPPTFARFASYGWQASLLRWGRREDQGRSKENGGLVRRSGEPDGAGEGW